MEAIYFTVLLPEIHPSL